MILLVMMMGFGLLILVHSLIREIIITGMVPGVFLLKRVRFWELLLRTNMRV